MTEDRGKLAEMSKISTTASIYVNFNKKVKLSKAYFQERHQNSW